MSNCLSVRRSVHRTLCVALCTTLAGAAHAADGPHAGVALTAGASGIGADLAVGVNDYFGLRATIADISVSRNGNFGTSVDWDARLKLFQAGVLVDFFPLAGSFRLSTGIVKDGNRFTLDGHPNGGNFTFNGNSYPSNYVNSANATVDWSKAVPYLGLGWGNLAGGAGLHFTSDIGVLISGSPKASVSVACSSAGQQAGVCAQLASDVASEQTKLQNDVHGLTVWPVVRVGIGFSF